MQKELEDKDIDLHIDRETLLQEYIPRKDYEQRLKDDMVAMLGDLDLEIQEMESAEEAAYCKDDVVYRFKVYEIVREKINSLKEKEDEK